MAVKTALAIGEAPSRAQKIPEDYLKKVKEMHELGAIVSQNCLRVELILFLLIDPQDNMNMNQCESQYESI